MSTGAAGDAKLSASGADDAQLLEGLYERAETRLFAPWRHKENHPAWVHAVTEVTVDFFTGARGIFVVAYKPGAVWHMALIVCKQGKDPIVFHHWGGDDQCLLGQSFADAGVCDRVHIIRLVQERIQMEGLEARIDEYAEGRCGAYHSTTNNCEHYVTYIMCGKKFSFSVETGSRVVADVAVNTLKAGSKVVRSGSAASGT